MLRRIGQVALRWLLEQSNVIIISGAKNAAQAHANAGAKSYGLSPAEFEARSTATTIWRP